MKKVAILNFYHRTFDDQQVVVYLCDRWGGEPTESEEMFPRWFNIKEIPYQFMWPDDAYWMPKILEGKYVEAYFSFDSDTIIEHKILKETDL